MTRSPLQPQLDKGIGRLAHHGQQVPVGDGAGLVDRISDPVEGDPVAVAGFNMAVHAVVGGIDAAADEPFGERQVPLEHLVPMSVPRQLLSLFGPPPLRVGGRLGIDARLGVGPTRSRPVAGTGSNSWSRADSASPLWNSSVSVMAHSRRSPPVRVNDVPRPLRAEIRSPEATWGQGVESESSR